MAQLIYEIYYIKKTTYKFIFESKNNIEFYKILMKI